MIIKDFTACNSVIQEFVSELRDEKIQQDRMRFRFNVERIGQALSYEMSKTLRFYSKEVVTPFGKKQMLLPQKNLVIASILRAGLTLQKGVINNFDDAEQAFISAYRNKYEDGSFEIVVKYIAVPPLDDKILILCDPMIATGYTLENVYKAISKHGTPKSIHIISVIGSQNGVNYIQKVFPEDTTLWIASIDSKLNNHKYIIPGLGDAGDLSFGEKMKL